MNNETAATAPALTTVEEALNATGRAEVLNQFAKLALGRDLAKAAADGVSPDDGTVDNTAAQEATDAKQSDLSQPNAEETEVAPEATAEDAVDESEDDDGTKGKLENHTQQAINRRIAKEVAKTKAAQEAKAGLETKLAELQQQLEQKQAETSAAPQIVPTAANPLLHVTDMKQLQVERDNAVQAQDQADELLESLQDDPGRVESALRSAKVQLADSEGNEDYSAARMGKFLRSVRREARNMVERSIPQQAQYLERSAQAWTQAQAVVPELVDAKSARAQKFQDVIKAFPELRRIPDWPIAAAVHVLGLEALEARAKQATPPKPKAKLELPVKIPSPRATAPPVQKRNVNEVSDETVSAAIGGDKNARMKFIQSLVPKFG